MSLLKEDIQSTVAEEIALINKLMNTLTNRIFIQKLYNKERSLLVFVKTSKKII